MLAEGMAGLVDSCSFQGTASLTVQLQSSASDIIKPGQ